MDVIIGAISVRLWHSSVHIGTLGLNGAARGTITRIPALTIISLVLNGPSMGIITLMTEGGSSHSRGNGGRPL